ncbi:Eco57I restriction-modification methylase domain-containing protein [Hydrogenophaga sp. PBL-H3]|uniref:Eco57I restriction-modification methylase domain-containing protein n=1 Tax=Hydrogenophaga sp. PBL-H3 TaxID=434010 RepID=UPI00131FC652|nr:DNA methyltransferase [Hydrogenophaga sp. PBL-H3]QHE76132.1 restriction endonuclease [Hydrogenophaga sp. PBL-H3]QHE80556.1 restriction endonuclease [Hydrogenophaga sp. PBL-H3]
MSPPSVSRQHADWLSLVEVSGPFVSLPVLMRAFPQGLDARDPVQAKALREAFEDWQDNPAAAGKQRAWLLHVLAALLGYPSHQVVEGQALPAGLEARMPEMGETLRPDLALVGPAGTDSAGQTQLLIATYPAEQALDKPVTGRHWKATPGTRMMELLHGAGVSLGLVTNGEQWMLVYAPRGEVTGYASWYTSLWLDEPITLRAFHSLLGVRRFFGVAADGTLQALLRESASDQQEVTDQLGYQVREAVEVLVQSFDALDKESNRTLLKGVSPAAQYDAALTVMMRLVFLFSAEERGLLHLGKPLYDDNYAVSTLQEQLQEVADQHGEEVLERRSDAWARLLASFRAVHAGTRHQDLLMQAYGGSLFDPDRYAFLEGRAAGSNWRNTAADPLAVNNRVVLHLLNSLQRLRIRGGAGGTTETRRVSFRALGVEQIGHVYEGLLDHTAVRATEPVLGLKGTRRKEPEIALAKLELLLAQGQDKLIDFLKEETGRSAPAIRRTLNEGGMLDAHRLLLACNQDESLQTRLRPFAGLIRSDSFEQPLVVLTGSVFVTAGSTRRSTGAHYTPPSLTEPIVQHTLEPLVYLGPAEGLPRDAWKLKSPKEILSLKVCDMAMGSGAFLVQVCRYLAERLTEAWENEESRHPGEVLITPDGVFSAGNPSERLVPADSNERIAIARRVVADRCLYGVDINPMAVEMAKLSLWLITVDSNRPFTFLDHALKCGDSLLGITSLEQLENFSMRPGGGRQHAFGTLNLQRHIEEAQKKREELESMPSDTPEQISVKASLYAEAGEAVAKLNSVADVLIAVEMKELKGRAYDTEREASVDHMMIRWVRGVSDLKDFAKELIHYQVFHWALEFPEVLRNGGFDAFVGNPPFMGGKKITAATGTDYRNYCVTHLAKGVKGNADLCAYFFLRASSLCKKSGLLGLVATNTIGQGETREVALDQLVVDSSIIRAVSSTPWPGAANLEVAYVWAFKGLWSGDIYLDGIVVPEVGSDLMEVSKIRGKPYVLSSNSMLGFQGTIVLGLGFVLQPEEGRLLIQRAPRSRDILFPYINGEDLLDRFDQTASRWVINFGDRSLDEAAKYAECMSIVVANVKPERDILKDKGYREKWWQFGRRAVDLYQSISGLHRVIAMCKVAKHCCMVFVDPSQVFSNRLTVFAMHSGGHLALLQSTLHEVWARKYSATLETRLSYTPTDCFETFPFPELSQQLNRIGDEYSEARQSIMINRGEGLTQTYNRFHDPDERSSDIAELRRLHTDMDQAISAAYGWVGLDLGHAFQKSKQGIRFTISETAHHEVLDRLLALNHQRHAEEEAKNAVLPAARSAKGGRKQDDNRGQIEMNL